MYSIGAAETLRRKKMSFDLLNNKMFESQYEND
jgi:hypothetical protein